MDDFLRPRRNPRVTKNTNSLEPSDPPEVVDPQIEVFNKELEREVPDEPNEQAVEDSVAVKRSRASLLLLPAKATASKLKKHWIYLKHLNLSKKQWALLIAGLLILVSGAAFGGYKLYQHVRKAPKTSSAKEQKTLPPKPKTEASRLSGLQIDPALNLRPVTGVMIENSPDARPQSGLNQAGVVFEAIAEGGITRFLALFQDAQPDYIGPVRSARPYYIDWLLPFDASYVHVGGSPEALSLIRSRGVKDLDQFANAGGFTRVSNRYAPHNVYTSTEQLDALNQAKGFTASTFTGFERKNDAPLATPVASSIDLAISSYYYNVHYDYDKATNSYKRSEGGAAHTDERSGATITPKVVVALVTQYGIDSDGQHSDYSTTGSGTMYVFQDGYVTTGTWAKSSHSAQFTFTDANGAAIKLNPGQTWISIVDAASDVTYK